MQVGLPTTLPKINQLKVDEEQNSCQNNIAFCSRIVEGLAQVLEGALLCMQAVYEAALGKGGCIPKVLQVCAYALLA
jgi:hypothetical protein